MTPRHRSACQPEAPCIALTRDGRNGASASLWGRPGRNGALGPPVFSGAFPAVRRARRSPSPGAGCRYGAGVDVIETDERLGPYRLLTRIGEGGMGVVHLALDTEGRAVAVKVLRPHLISDETGRSRLVREVEALRRVVGPYVAEVLDADVVGAAPYLVMRYVQGRSLTERVERNGPLRGEELHALAVGLARALAAIHDVGVVHRDLKPGNVLLADGEPVVVDFGLAQFADDTRLTATGMLLGTPGYLAPEALGGAPADPAADIHGWAATIVYAATGHPPYGTGPFEVVLGRVLQGETDLDGVPAWLLPLVVRGLRPDPAARMSTGQLLDALGVDAPGLEARDEATAYVPLPAAPRTLPAPAPHAPAPHAPAPHAAASAVSPWPESRFDTRDQPWTPADLDEPVQHVPPPQTLRSYPVLFFSTLVCLTAAACLAPIAAVGASVVASVLLRTVHAVEGLVRRRRSSYGRRGTDGLVAVGALPWLVLKGLLVTLATVPQALVGALATGGVVLAFTSGVRPELATPAFHGLVAAVSGGALLATAYGPASTALRAGFDRTVGSVLHGRPARTLATLVVLATAAGLLAMAWGERASTWPLSQTPASLTGIVDAIRSW